MTDFSIPTYRTEFSSACDLIAAAVEQWVHSGPQALLDIDQFDDCVYIKLSTRVIANANVAYQAFYSRNNRVAGSVGDGFLDPATIGVAAKSDELLFSSGKMLEFDYVSTGPGGDSFHVKTHKRWISPNRRNLSILGVSRILAKVDAPPPTGSEYLVGLARIYESLDTNDRALCCLMAAGNTQREMADFLGCTTRTIENRRNRIMEELRVNKPIEIVKLMVRLAEHGLIPPDF